MWFFYFFYNVCRTTIILTYLWIYVWNDWALWMSIGLRLEVFIDFLYEPAYELHSSIKDVFFLLK